MSTPNDDDDGGYEKPKLDCIIGASLVDDWGASSAVLDRIIKFYRSWYNRRSNDRPLGLGKDIRPIPLAGSQIKSKKRLPALSSNG